MVRDRAQGTIEHRFRARVTATNSRLVCTLAVLTRDTCGAFGTFGTNRALGTLDTLDTLRTLGTLCTSYTSGALNALLTLRTLRACGTLQLADAGPSVYVFRPDVALTIFCNQIQIFITTRMRRFQRSKRCVCVFDVQALAILTGRTGRTLSTGGTLCTSRTSRTSRTGDALCALRTNGTLNALGTLNTLRTTATLCTLFALNSLRSLRATDRHAGRSNSSILDAEGHISIDVNTRNDCGTRLTDVTLLTLFALDALNTLRTSITFQSLNNSRLAIISHNAVLELQSAALCHHNAVGINNQMPGASGCLPDHAVFAGFQNLVCIQPYINKACFVAQTHDLFHAQPFQLFHQTVKSICHNVSHQSVKNRLVLRRRTAQNVRCRHNALRVHFLFGNSL